MTSPAIQHDTLEHAAQTDVGMRRSHNQDNFGLLPATSAEAWRDRGHLFMVADGMGAHAVGELAAEIAAKHIPNLYQKYAPQGAAPALRKAFTEANGNIHQRGQANREFQGMGTTSTALVLRPEGAWIGHVGDSRCYRIRAGRVEQLSFDHSLQWELARRQHISPDRIAGIPSNVIVRSLGPEPHVQVDVEGPHPILPGDTYVLCSDGLSNQVGDQELGSIVTHLPLSEACQFLVDLANLRGGPDNITVIIVRIPGQPPDNLSQALKALTAIARPGPSILQRLPWPILSIAAGILLAIAALFVRFATDKPDGLVLPAMLLFVLSAALFLAGMVGQFLHFKSAQTPSDDEDAPAGPPRVHRHGPGSVDTALVEKFMQATANLQELIKEKNWQADWEKHDKLCKSAASALKAGEPIKAFVDQCRALAILTAVLREHRGKDEAFKPNW